MPEVLTAPRVMTGDETVTDGAVVIGDRTVDWAGPAAALPAEYLALPRTDYPGSTIMPGLIDSHVHLGFDGGPNPAARMRGETDEQQLMLMLRSARELLGVGVTTARDLGARAYLDVVVRDAIAAGLARGPRLVVAACPITVTGGHCWFMGGEADSEDDLRRIVRTHHKHGADLIKVMSTGGFMTTGSAPWYAQFTTAQLAVIVEEASRVDKPVAAHAHGIEGIRRAVEAGVTTLEHCSFVTETNERRFNESLAARIAEQSIFVCPTISANAPYIAELTGIEVGAHVKAMHEHGGADHRGHRRGHRQQPAPPVRRRAGIPGDPGLPARRSARDGHHRGGGGARPRCHHRPPRARLRRGPHRRGRRPAGRYRGAPRAAPRHRPGPRLPCPTAAGSTSARPARPYASPDHAVDLRLVTEATRRRKA